MCQEGNRCLKAEGQECVIVQAFWSATSILIGVDQTPVAIDQGSEGQGLIPVPW